MCDCHSAPVLRDIKDGCYYATNESSDFLSAVSNRILQSRSPLRGVCLLFGSGVCRRTAVMALDIFSWRNSIKLGSYHGLAERSLANAFIMMCHGDLGN